ISCGSKWGGSQARIVSVPPRRGACARAAPGRLTAAAPAPARASRWRRVREPNGAWALMTPSREPRLPRANHVRPARPPVHTTPPSYPVPDDERHLEHPLPVQAPDLQPEVLPLRGMDLEVIRLADGDELAGRSRLGLSGGQRGPVLRHWLPGRRLGLLEEK